MLDIEIALDTKLITTLAITALAGARVHPISFPDTPTLPCIVYQEISAPTDPVHGGTSATVYTTANYQIDAWATSYSVAVALGKAIFDVLEGFGGIIVKGADMFTIQNILRTSRRKNKDPDTNLFWVSQDFTISY